MCLIAQISLQSERSPRKGKASRTEISKYSDWREAVTARLNQLPNFSSSPARQRGESVPLGKQETSARLTQPWMSVLPGED